MSAQLIARRKDYDVLHVVDFDTGVFGVPIARLLGKPVIYDAFDSIGAIMGGGRLGSFLSNLERRWIGAASIVVFPDPIRLEQYGVSETRRTTVISNIPDEPELPPSLDRPDDARLRLVYIGTLEAHHRGLEYIPEVCRALGDRIDFVVGGTGQLHSFFLDQANAVSNLSYIGHQDYQSALQQMAVADILYGPYLLSTPAHRYASPNKMYEHLALGRALLTNTGTPPARMVEEAGSGFLFDGSQHGLIHLLASLDTEKCRTAGERARRIWDEKFSTLRQTQLDHFFARLQDLETGR